MSSNVRPNHTLTGYNYQGQARTRSPHLLCVLVRLDAFGRTNGNVPAARAIARDRPRGHLIASMERQPNKEKKQDKTMTLTSHLMFRIKKNLNHYCDTCNKKTKLFVYKLAQDGPPESINTHVYLKFCHIQKTSRTKISGLQSRMNLNHYNVNVIILL